MITLGIDLSSQSKNTAACRIDWAEAGGARVDAPVLGCDDAALYKLIADSHAVGVDAPFGWPETFRAAVASWREEAWIGRLDMQRSLRLRITDMAVRDRFKSSNTKLTPLSVSSDRIALPAMRAMALLKRHGVTDKSGDGRFFEVYPTGTLACWSLTSRGYKTGAEAPQIRRKILKGIRMKFPTMNIPDGYHKCDHALDALISAITARLAKVGDTIVANESEKAAARIEGWIHLPK